MALKLYDTLTPDGDYPLMKAKDVEMPDGTRLSEFEGGGGGSVSWEDMPDKPFYEVEGEKEILAETTLEFVEPQTMISPSPFILVEGEKYLVVWDGAEHECVCALDSDGALYLTDFQETAEGATGNFGIAYGSPEITGEEGGISLFQTYTGLGTHTVAIYQDTTVIKHLDNKYLEILEGEDKIEVEILPEQTITLEADNQGNPTASGFTHIALPEDGTLYSSLYSLEVGQTYTVVWEGIEYTCVAQDMSEFITSISSAAVITKVVSLGNLGYNGSGDFEDTGEPFVILLADYAVGDTVNQMVSLQAKLGITETTYDVTLSITKVSGGYKIKEEYLPDISGIVKPATAVDLTAFESDGIIVETYADGSTVTTTMERNAEGKITKITDSNGNVTVMTR